MNTTHISFNKNSAETVDGDMLSGNNKLCIPLLPLKTLCHY